jgi:hypothetical protein
MPIAPIAPIHRFTGNAISLSINITAIAHPQHQHDHEIVLNAGDDPKITDAVLPELAKGRAF